MNFTPEHIEVLEKHKEHWTSLKEAGFMRNIDRPVFDALQKVHNEAIAIVHFTHWCGECVAEMVKIIYGHYERYQDAQTVVPEPPLKKRHVK